MSAPTDGTTGLSYLQVDAGYEEGAICAGGNAPAVDAAGNVFVATGNGKGNSTSDPQYGDSVVKLNAVASPLDWRAPPDWQALDSSDADLGSGMPTLLPGGFLFQSGKDTNGYLLNGAGLGSRVANAVDKLSGFCSQQSFGGSVYDPGNSTIYVACNGGLRAVSFGSSPIALLAWLSGMRAATCGVITPSASSFRTAVRSDARRLAESLRPDQLASPESPARAGGAPARRPGRLPRLGASLSASLPACVRQLLRVGRTWPRPHHPGRTPRHERDRDRPPHRPTRRR